MERGLLLEASFKANNYLLVLVDVLINTFDLSSASLAFCPSCFPPPLPSCHTVPFFFSFLPPPACDGVGGESDCSGVDKTWAH